MKNKPRKSNCPCNLPRGFQGEDNLRGDQRFVIGDEVMTREELFEGKERFRRERAKIPFGEKIKELVNLQKIASVWGKKKNVIIWKLR
ncbi:MAG: hypothetical protein ABIJ15_03865 [bacterium]